MFGMLLQRKKSIYTKVEDVMTKKKSEKGTKDNMFVCLLPHSSESNNATQHNES